MSPSRSATSTLKLGNESRHRAQAIEIVGHAAEVRADDGEARVPAQPAIPGGDHGLPPRHLRMAVGSGVGARLRDLSGIAPVRAGVCSRCAARTAWAVGAANGGLPVRISYPSTPSA